MKGENIMKDTLNVPTSGNKFTGAMIFLHFLLIIIALFAVSAFDTDKTVSEKENRTLATFPKFSLSAVFSGQFSGDFEEYYSDTFPMRDVLLDVNSYITKYASQFAAGEDDVVIIETNKGEEDFAGESLGDMADTLNE